MKKPNKTNLLAQPLIALNTMNVKASKEVDFQNLYTNNLEKLDVIEDILVTKSEGAKAEVELLREVSEVLSSMRLRIDFEKLYSIEMSGKYSRIQEIEDELIRNGIDVSKDYPIIISELAQKGIVIKYLAKEELEFYKGNVVADLIIERLKLKSEIQQFEALKESQVDGYIKPNFHLWGSLSGRVITYNPSIQNLPKYYKKYILPLSDNESVYELDIKASEIIALGYLTNQEEILSIITRGEDIYTYIFSKIFNKNPEDITESTRDLVKKMTNGINLGLGIERLKDMLNNSGILKRSINELEAEKIRNKYYELFPKVKEHFLNIRKANKLMTDLKLEIDVEPSYKNQSFNQQNVIATLMKCILTSMTDYKHKIVNFVHDSIWFSGSSDELKIIKDIMEESCKQLIPTELLQENIELIRVKNLGGE